MAKQTALQEAISFYKDLQKYDKEPIWEVIVKKLESLLPKEREQIEKAHKAGQYDAQGKYYHKDAENHFTYTYNTTDNE